MKITANFLSIPPYISLPWDEVAALRTAEKNHAFTLIVTLKNNTTVEVPNLPQADIDAIFEGHTRFLQQQPKFPVPFSFSIPMSGDGATSAFGGSMEHNPAQSDLPNLPPPLLEKLSMILKSIGVGQGDTLSEPVENCNCIHCQIIRSLGTPDAVEEPVAIEDLSFRDWDVTPIGGQLYKVTNPLDKNEHYDVFLGSPLGCTCGHTDCEHIKAALQT